VSGHVLTAKGRAASGPEVHSPRGVDDWTFGHSAFATLCRHHLKHDLELCAGFRAIASSALRLTAVKAAVIERR
jgi:hypothetical protein